jgi:cysteine desulfurase
LGVAVRLAATERQAEAVRIGALRDALAMELTESVPDLRVTAEAAPRAPHVLNLLVAGADSEALLMHLDLAGVAASSGSACTTGALEPSHVLTGMGLPREVAVGAIRLSLGRETVAADVARVAEVLPKVVEKVRKLGVVLGR